jgi:hypothetical protein
MESKKVCIFIGQRTANFFTSKINKSVLKVLLLFLTLHFSVWLFPFVCVAIVKHDFYDACGDGEGEKLCLIDGGMQMRSV